MTKQRILVVEDVPSISSTIASHLNEAGFEVDILSDGEAAANADLLPYAAVTLDAMLPRMSGFEVCRRWRASSALPVVMLTALTDPADRIEAFDAGVDDFMTKPFDAVELVARLRSLLRKAEADGRANVAERTVGDLRIDLIGQAVEVGGRLVRLTPVECRILGLLSEVPGRTCTREQIVFHLWGSTYLGESRACDAHVKNLRKKVESDPMNPTRIRTVRGVGYSLHEPDSKALQWR
jgi:DNA-binding response OmpR family regulator